MAVVPFLTAPYYSFVPKLPTRGVCCWLVVTVCCLCFSRCLSPGFGCRDDAADDDNKTARPGTIDECADRGCLQLKAIFVCINDSARLPCVLLPLLLPDIIIILVISVVLGVVVSVCCSPRHTTYTPIGRLWDVVLRIRQRISDERTTVRGKEVDWLESTDRQRHTDGCVTLFDGLINAMMSKLRRLPTLWPSGCSRVAVRTAGNCEFGNETWSLSFLASCWVASTPPGWPRDRHSNCNN